MSDFRSNLQSMADALKGLEERARKLKNQNLADIVASAHNRVRQIPEHADLDLVDEHKDQTDYPDGTPVLADPTTKDAAVNRMRMEGNGNPEGTARMRWPHLFEPSPDYPAPFPQQVEPRTV